MSVTVVTCLYGTGFGGFVPGWTEAIGRLEPSPDHIILACDNTYEIPYGFPGEIIEAAPEGHPQAFYYQLAVSHAETEWVWPLDIDDLAIPNALRGLDSVDADVWQMGFDRSDGEMYVPPLMTNDEYLRSDRNVYVGGSAFRTDVFHECGGYPDIALQDWGLWRRFARAGAKIVPSGRVHFRYMRHPRTRGETELTLDVRAAHLAEMMESEHAHA